MTVKSFLQTLAAAVLAAAILPANAFAGVNIRDGKWRNGSFVWYYNNQLLPPGVRDSDFLALMNQAFGLWSAGCNVTPRYGGLTTVDTSYGAIAANQVVVAWAHLPSGMGGSGGPFSVDAQSNYYYFTSGSVQIAADMNAYQMQPERLMITLVHEVGHLLNLAHSDEPKSVMYANPYSAISSAKDPYKLYGDDIATCANLYGARGVQPSIDYGAVPFTPDPRYRLSASVGSFESNGGASVAFGGPADKWQPLSPNAVDVAASDYSPWMRVAWDNPPFDSGTVRIIAPTGDIVLDNWSFLAGPRNTVPQGYQPFRYEARLNGVWKVQVFVNGNPAAETRFTAVNGVPSPPKLELAAIAESTSSSGMAFRVANYSRVGIVSLSVFANGDYSRPVQSVAKAAGLNAIELWAQSNIPRYNIGSGCGQPGSSSDLARKVSFSADAAGRIVSSAIDVSETGTLIAYSSKANIQASDNGAVGVYVAMQVNGSMYFRQTDGTWGAPQTPLFTFTGPGAANFDIIRDFDTRDLPAGATLYVGYGDTLNHMVANKQYNVVHTF